MLQYFLYHCTNSLGVTIMAYTAFVLTDSDRELLLKEFPPKYSEFIGHHITVEFGVSADTPPPVATGIIEVINHVDSGDGLEAMVVTIDKDSQRPDGGCFHITWSLDRDKYKPVDSNRVIATSETRRADFDIIEINPIGATLQ
jgi:hypothetical protein